MTTTSTAAVVLASSAARAAVSEIDKYGSLYTPKKEMLAGGSNAARGYALEKRNDNNGRSGLKLGQQIQTIYETRFVAYLSRFLINFDDAANAYWKEQTKKMPGEPAPALDLKFAEFSESVEIGLADYFVGPYGSYSSLSAMKAGISANYQAKSKRYEGDEKEAGSGILGRLANGLRSRQKPVDDELTRKEVFARNRFAKQGILNLYTLLKARYQSQDAKIQLAILFSFISNPNYQPTAEIRSLLAEVDDATISEIELNKDFLFGTEQSSRTSCKRGGGYPVNAPPVITIDVPPALGANYKLAKAKPTMRCTSRVLRINVIDGGAGYVKCPEVFLSSPDDRGGSSRPAVAQAIIDRMGKVESILVLDPGYGYGRNNKNPPKITIKPPEDRGSEKSSVKRQAIAKAELEYEIASIEVINGGNGFVASEPPKIYITPPEQEPDWYIDIANLSVSGESKTPQETFGASVLEMRCKAGNIAYSSEIPTDVPFPEDSLKRVKEDPIALLPPTIRPKISNDAKNNAKYTFSDVAAVKTLDKELDNPRFRAVDPLFGAIGALPVQKGALALDSDEYGRLALSGAVCTVLVRTALNPLELIKTKLQLQNDEELLTYARNKIESPDHGPAPDHIPSGGGGDSEIEVESREYPSRGPPSVGQAKASFAADIRIKTNLSETGYEGGLAVATKPATAVAIKTVTMEVNVTTEEETQEEETKLGAKDLIFSLIELRGLPSIFQAADITLLASIMFGSLGFGATELFRRSFTEFFFEEAGSINVNQEVVLLLAAAFATIVTCAAAAPFELLRVRSMGLTEPTKWTMVMSDFLNEKLERKLKKAKGMVPNKQYSYDEQNLDPNSLAWMRDVLDEKLNSYNKYGTLAKFSNGLYGSDNVELELTSLAWMKGVLDEKLETFDSKPLNGVYNYNEEALDLNSLAWMRHVLDEKIIDYNKEVEAKPSHEEFDNEHKEFDMLSLDWKDYLPLWAGFGPTTTRELAFAIPKFLAFDVIAKSIVGLINSQIGQGALPVQVGVGGAGLAISAFSGACAGIAGALVSHPADLILTRLSASSKAPAAGEEEVAEIEEANWKDIVDELLAKEGGIANLYVGLAPRLVFFFLVIGLQFFLYDFIKNILEVGSDDLSLVLDVFYAVRQGLIEQST